MFSKKNDFVVLFWRHKINCRLNFRAIFTVVISWIIFGLFNRLNSFLKQAGSEHFELELFRAWQFCDRAELELLTLLASIYKTSRERARAWARANTSNFDDFSWARTVYKNKSKPSLQYFGLQKIVLGKVKKRASIRLIVTKRGLTF